MLRAYVPDLFGISSPTPFSADQQTGLSRLRSYVLEFRAGEAQAYQGPSCSISAVSHYPGDRASLISSRDRSSALASIGRFPAADSTESLASFVRDLRAGHIQELADVPAPFAGAVWAGPDELWLLGDRYGFQPIYYAAQAGILVFCTKFVPLLRCGLLEWVVDAQSVVDFFAYEHLQGNRTFADPVRVLPPGTALRFSGETELLPYAQDLAFTPRSQMSLEDLAGQMYRELRRAVQEEIADHERVAVTLTGGLDSRALLGCALDCEANLRTYTFGHPESRDVRYAQELASRSGVPHRTVPITGSYLLHWLDPGIHVTGGMVSCVHFHIAALAELLASESDVVLDGLGGDALSGAHLRFRMVASSSKDAALERLYRERATVLRAPAERRTLFEEDFLAAADHDPRDALRDHFVEDSRVPAWWGCHRYDLLERQRRFIQYGPHHVRSLVPVATPFYSRGFFDLTTATPVKYLMGQRAYLLMHRQQLPQLAGVPDATYGVPVSWHRSLR